MRRALVAAVLVALTLASLVLAARLELSRDLTALFPHTREAEALARVTRIFGGGDASFVLLRGGDADEVTAAARDVASALRKAPSVDSVLEGPPSIPVIGPAESFRYAGPRARAKLAAALEEDGMRARLRETRSLLLAPGAGDVEAMITRDPLRLAAIPWEIPVELAAGARGAFGGSFAANAGRTRLVLASPKGRAFEGADAERFAHDAEAALADARRSYPHVRFDLAGGHVVARETEALVRGDLERSGVVSLVLASVVFIVTFRRPRALVAVLPPLLAGTAWTMGLAWLLYPRLSAVATGFAAVVVGVGVDTGVHVYGRLLEARREGLTPALAAHAARRDTWKPTLGAAISAGGAFGCLALSDIDGMRQLGSLCAAGEVLTAIAILLVVPEVGAWLERRPVPPALRWSGVARATATPARAVAMLTGAAVIMIAAASLGLPRLDHGVVRLDGRTLPALATYDAIYEAFGGTRGQLTVVSADPDEARARARADAVAETAELLQARGLIDGFDALGQVAPSPAAVAARLAYRDGLDLPHRARVLARLLAEEGFDASAFEPGIKALAAGEAETGALAESEATAWVTRRHLGRDAGGAVVVTFVRPTGDAARDGEARAALKAADPDALVTSYADLERGLKETLATDLPRVLVAAGAIVVMSVFWAFRSARAVVLAFGVLAVEIAMVLVLARLFGIRWHVYDALVLPVLLGITLDEALFLFAATERGSIEDALAEQAPLGAATALTTAAGFIALVACRFPGLSDLGKVGALGSAVGLASAMLVIPAGLRLTRAKAAR